MRLARRYDKMRAMDPILAAQRLPRLAERAMRAAIAETLRDGHLTPRALVDRALGHFERATVQIGGVRPALLFSERNRIAGELRAFVDGRLAARLRAQRRDAIMVGSHAAPFDVIVRNRRGRTYAIILRRLPRDGHRLTLFDRVRRAVQSLTRTPIVGVLIYDFSRGTTVLLDQAGAQGVDCYLRAS